MPSQEIVVKAPSLKQALSIASEKFSVQVQDISYKIVEKPKSSLFGKTQEGVYKVWKSPLLDSVLHRGGNSQSSYRISKSMDSSEIPETENIGIDVYDHIVIVKDNGIFVRLDPQIHYNEATLVQAFRKRGVLSELESKIPEILTAHPTEFKKMANFTGSLADKSELLLTFNDDNTKAYLTMKYPKIKGGPTCSYEEVIEFLKNQGVHYGLRFSNIRILVQREVLETAVLVAMGKPAIVEHTVAYKKYYLPQDIEPPLDNKSSVDFKNHLVKYRSFKKGELVCEKIGKTPFVPGIDVFGNPINHAHGDQQEAILTIGEHLSVSENGEQIFADIDGFVVEKDNIMTMSPFLHIRENIGYNTGNINVLGDIIISGDVQAGFKVQSTGNITIDGFVQRAMIISDKDIHVKKGIIGGEIRSKGSLITHYIDFAKVYTMRNIICRQEITNSLVQCSGYILLYGSKGSIVGGEIVVRKGVMARRIGTELQGTKMTIGLDPLVLDIQKQLLNEKEKIIKKNQKLQFQATRLKRDKVKTPEKQEEEKNLIQTLEENNALLQKFDKELVRINEHFDKQKKEGFLSFYGILSAGVQLNLNRIDIPINEKISNKTIRVENQRIVVIPHSTSTLEKQILSLYKV